MPVLNRIQLVDFLRGISIFTIVVMHFCQGFASGVLSKVLAFGGAGVHVFILCSGLGLYLSYLRKPLRYKDFLHKRFAKVYVPYAIAVMLWGVWFLVSEGTFPISEVASHLLLFKMFSVEFDTSLCGPYWFISTIIQFYLAWPLIVRLVCCRGGYFVAFAISLAWSTLVGVLGYEELRPWGSFFLQYLWEFCLGMWIAEQCLKTENYGYIEIRNIRWWWLLVGAIGGIGLTGLLAWNGGVLKLYNDIPSLVGYLSTMLLIYKVGLNVVNSFFVWASGFSYELYLIHFLVFCIMVFFFKSVCSTILLISICLVAAYMMAYMYSFALRLLKIK